MLFNSLEYLALLPISIAWYFLMPQKHRWIVLLTTSYLFYASRKFEYLALILLSTSIDYFSAIKIYETNKRLKKKFFLWLSLSCNLLLLFSFKYFNFFSDIAEQVLHFFSVSSSFERIDVLLPIGISFYTFQTMSYTIDVYRGKIQPERHFGVFASFVAFFPQLVAGPIERAGDLIPQLLRKNTFSYNAMRVGALLILWGLFKKLVVADGLASFVDPVYSSPDYSTGFWLFVTTFLFHYQAYCDFSGYTDIAIGSAAIFGIQLTANFKRPIQATSITDFWRRWHITLGRWAKDYIYLPIKGEKRIAWKRVIAVTATFVAIGLWHGANYTFVVFGFIHSLYMVMEMLFKKPVARLKEVVGLVKWPKIDQLLGIVYTNTLMVLSLVFFRSESIEKAKYIFVKIFTDFLNFENPLYLASRHVFYALILFMLIVEFVHWRDEKVDLREALLKRSLVVRWTVYSVMAVSILIFATFQGREYIYFAF